jgi:hypothetical protein
VQKLPYAVFVLPSYASICPLSPNNSYDNIAALAAHRPRIYGAPYGGLSLSSRYVPGRSLRMPLLYANSAFTQCTQHKASLIPYGHGIPGIPGIGLGGIGGPLRGGGPLPAGLSALFGPDTEASQVCITIIDIIIHHIQTNYTNNAYT